MVSYIGRKASIKRCLKWYACFLPQSVALPLNEKTEMEDDRSKEKGSFQGVKVNGN